MFKFKMKIDSEHKIKAKVNNEHGFKAYIKNTSNFVFTAIDALIYHAATFISNIYKSTSELVRYFLTVKEKGEHTYHIREKIMFTIEQRFGFKDLIYRLTQKEGRTMLDDWGGFDLKDLSDTLQKFVGNGLGVMAKVKFNNDDSHFTDSLNSGRLIKTRAENEYGLSANEALFEVMKK